MASARKATEEAIAAEQKAANAQREAEAPGVWKFLFFFCGGGVEGFEILGGLAFGGFVFFCFWWGGLVLWVVSERFVVWVWGFLRFGVWVWALWKLCLWAGLVLLLMRMESYFMLVISQG